MLCEMFGVRIKEDSSFQFEERADSLCTLYGFWPTSNHFNVATKHFGANGL